MKKKLNVSNNALNGINDNGLLYKFSNDRNKKTCLTKYLRKRIYNGEKII